MTDQVTTNQKFGAMLRAAGGVPRTGSVHVSLDPGGTTGVCWYLPWETTTPIGGSTNLKLHLVQVDTKDVVQGIHNLEAVLPKTDLPITFTMEDYKVYGWKADDHSWADLHTSQLIGALKYWIATKHPNSTLIMRMAQHAKAWATDEKLQDWGCYHKGMKHARDAQRHLITTLFFGATIK